MTSFREVHDQRIRQLAETLKRNGLAASETEAVNMAQSMAQTESRVNSTFNEKKDAAVMSTGGKGPSGNAATMNTLQRSEDHFRDKEVSAQDSAAQRQPASQFSQTEQVERTQEDSAQPRHSNDAIAEAISNVQQAYGEPQNINIESSPQRNSGNSLSGVLEQESHREEQTFEENIPSPEPQSQQMMYEKPPFPEQEQESRVESQQVNEHREEGMQESQATTNPSHQNISDHTQDQEEDEDGMVERTQEITQRAPPRNTNHFAESKVDLADVFNANK